MESMSVQNVFMIIGITIALGMASMLFDARKDLARWWRRVNGSRSRYVAPPRVAPPQNEAHNRPEAPVAANDNGARNAIAMRSNERNEELSRNERLRLAADIIARLIESDSLYIPDGKGGFKKLGQVALIKLATGLSPNGRPESEYGQLRAELEKILEPTMTVTEGSEVRSIAK